MSRYRILLSLLLLAGILYPATLPDFKLKDLNNQWNSVHELRGTSLTVIDFWATWCKPCLRALPELNRLSAEFYGQGVRFIGVSTDSPRNSAKVKPVVLANGLEYQVLRDENSEYASRLNITAIPTLLIINANGEIVYRHQGFSPGDEILLRAKLNQLLTDSK
jgi:peroxiredoxin